MQSVSLCVLSIRKQSSTFRKRGIDAGKIREHAAKLLTSGFLTSVLALSAPIVTHSLSPISQLFQTIWGIHVQAKLQGEHLNQTYGLIGAEQHLPRYPGDSAGQHGEYVQSGITPGKGVWSYFANSKYEINQDLLQKEKYYVAVQTLYLPDRNKRFAYLRDWYKYRKVLVVNPVNGKTIVAVIADAGPAIFTGKHFGGSPEVMAYLGLNVGKQKGPVVLFLSMIGMKIYHWDQWSIILNYE